MLTLLLVCAFFLHASTKVSCVGFIMRCPFPAIPTLARNDVVLRTSYKYFPQNKSTRTGALITRRKRREFDDFLGFFAGSENPSVLSVHGFSGSAKTPKRRKLSPFLSNPKQC